VQFFLVWLLQMVNLYGGLKLLFGFGIGIGIGIVAVLNCSYQECAQLPNGADDNL